MPDARTIWLFQDNLIGKQLEEKLFDRFHACPEAQGLFVNSSTSLNNHEGKIIFRQVQ